MNGVVQSSSVPGRGRYVWAALIPAIGVALFAAWLVFMLSKLDQGWNRMRVPGSQDLKLEQGGRYTVFLETQSEFEGRIYRTSPNLPGLQCELKEAVTGGAIPLSRPSMSKKYSLPGREGIAIFEFQIAKPGSYGMNCEFSSGGGGVQAVLAISRGFFSKLMITIGMGFAVLFISLLLGVAIALHTLIKRHQAIRLSTMVK